MVIEINLIEAAEIDEAANVTATAMYTNPMHVAAFQGQDEDKRLRQIAMFQVVLGKFPIEILVARHEGRIVGVMGMAEWPSCQMSIEESEKLLPLFKDALGDLTPRLRHWLSVWAQHDPREPHWHLGPIAVLPEFQGRGIGSRMLERFCAKADGLQAAAYLETDKPENVRLYERFGFALVETEDIFGINNKFMWRKRRGENP
jgi:ribosomal protein S18 acetylase RimI-like enzyme